MNLGETDTFANSESYCEAFAITSYEPAFAQNLSYGWGMLRTTVLIKRRVVDYGRLGSSMCMCS